MKEEIAPKLRWGRFRLQVIGPLLASPAASGELQAKLRELSERVYRHPLDPEMSLLLGFSTIERWYYQAKDAADPIVALSRKTRSDAGRREALSEALFGVLRRSTRRTRAGRFNCTTTTSPPRWRRNRSWECCLVTRACVAACGKRDGSEGASRRIRPRDSAAPSCAENTARSEATRRVTYMPCGTSTSTRGASRCWMTRGVGTPPYSARCWMTEAESAVICSGIWRRMPVISCTPSCRRC